MPIYEYRCGSCSFEKEYLQKVNDAPVAACPACGSDAYAKLISAAGFQLKGSGWYVTDFKNSAKPKAKPDSEAPVVAKAETATPTPPAAGAACPACPTD
ncbi:FmdB family zinc ribbon protein [Nitrosovibrio sp. Nv4]|uniref:FmdB family zinc ribbon protein n=1 Tax=Nitrosovibrio sp. Nv4 TaxID=1945880 RepID=UPI000BD25D17|nr:zinc ribbon domain-containing protein [Nitrosovibrio sp. Nv4]SOD40800.1 putative regulatory protein, FmdB family [Nitrosovibrio sp. Nv4]